MNTLRLSTVALVCLAFAANGRAESLETQSSLRRLPAIGGVHFASAPLILIDAEDAPQPPQSLDLPAPPVAAEEVVATENSSIMMGPVGPFSPYRGMGFMGTCCEIPNPCAADLWKGFHPHVCEHHSVFDHLHGWLKSHHGCGKCGACGEQPLPCEVDACGPKHHCLLHKHLPKFHGWSKPHGCEPPCGKSLPYDAVQVPMQAPTQLPMQKFHKPLWRHQPRHCESCKSKGFEMPGDYQSLPTEAVPQPEAPAEGNELNPPAPTPPTTARPRALLDFSDIQPPVFPGDKSA